MIRSVARRCRTFLDWYANLNYDIRTNGEGFLLERMAAFHPVLLFDVGANVGEWTALAKRTIPEAAVPAFEISHVTFARLEQGVAALDDVFCRDFGLSDMEGTVQIRHYDDMPALTTATEYPHPFPFVLRDARVTTGEWLLCRAPDLAYRSAEN